MRDTAKDSGLIQNRPWYRLHQIHPQLKVAVAHRGLNCTVALEAKAFPSPAHLYTRPRPRANHRARLRHLYLAATRSKATPQRADEQRQHPSFRLRL
jgi:hypothetical protein